ncbi:hypothetical protein [Rhodococcus oryzae]|uniref:immunity protein TriTu family protein n=1 Tax=Rhodococcus oryzae TaxID=2571143 RepID=UPI00378ACBBB
MNRVDVASVVENWVDQNRMRIESEDARLSVSYEVDRDPAAASLSIDGPERIGSVTVWDSGSAEFQVGAIANGTIVANESLNWRGADELGRICDRLMRSVLDSGQNPRMISSYSEAAEALARQLPSEITRVESSPGVFTIFGESWHLVVFCRWWFTQADALVIDGDGLDSGDAESIVDSLNGRRVVGFGYDTPRPAVARLDFADGSVLSFETDSDYEPWTLVTAAGSFIAALSDFG